jgi:hypothetical protein
MIGVDLGAFQDRVSVNRLYRMSLHASALRYVDRDQSFAALLDAAAQEAGRLADEAEEQAFRAWAERDGVEAA